MAQEQAPPGFELEAVPAGFTAEGQSTAPGAAPGAPPASSPKPKIQQPSTVGFAANVAKSTGDLIYNTLAAVDFAGRALIPGTPQSQAAGEAIKTGVKSLLPGTPESRQVGGAIVDALKKRYGSVDNILQTLYHDPAGVVGDLATLYGGLEAAGVKLPAKLTVTAPKIASTVTPAVAEAVKAGQAAGVPVDLATATGNKAVRGVQHLADRSIGGSMVAERTEARTAEALAARGEELAARARPGASVAPEQAGEAVSAALERKVAEHRAEANTAYDKLRELEQQPGNQITMPPAKAPVDELPEWQMKHLRQITHELDAQPYTPRDWSVYNREGTTPTGKGMGAEAPFIPASAGAPVYDEITQRGGGLHATRAEVQSDLEAFLGGGKRTKAVDNALEVAKERFQAGGTFPGLDVPTRLEGRRAGAPMGFPVLLQDTKAALAPIYEQMKRQLPLTQQQANPGLKAIENILQGPDAAALSQVDRDLSAIKAIAREQGGLAKVAVQKLEAAVQQAAKNGGPEVEAALRQGREATIAKYGAADVLDQMRTEPVQTFRKLTWAKDAGIEQLRAVAKQVPDAVPMVGRAYLEDLIGMATAEGGFKRADRLFADWQKLGPETKKLLYRDPTYVRDLDRFFLLAKKLAENPNPSGTGHIVSLGAQGGLLLTHPVSGLAIQLLGTAASQAMHSPAFVKALTNAMTIELQAGGAASTAGKARAVSEVLEAAKDAKIPLSAGGAERDRLARAGAEP